MNGKLLLKIEGMSKSFGITKALKNVHFELRAGEIHGLIGENGSGKSTISSIVAGVQKADSGEMYLNGDRYEPVSALDANEHSICMVLQEKGTFEGMTVANNIFAGKEAMFTKNGILNVRKMNQEAQRILSQMGVHNIKPDSFVESQSFEERKLIELARAVYTDPQILIIDEATTALSRDGRDLLYRLMEKMKAEGKSVIFISHDLDEFMEICDRLTVLRDGDYIATVEKAQYVASKIRQMMVGRDVADNYYRNDMACSYEKETVLEAKGVSSPELTDVSFQLHKGEILGFGGLADCGMHNLGNILFGLTKPDKGTVLCYQNTVISNQSVAIKNKIAYLSKNRDAESLLVSGSILDNICLASYRKIKRGPFIWKEQEVEFAQKLSEQLEIKCQSLEQFLVELSGGNKQKVAIAKWLGFGADIFIMDCPTRGIDIGVKANIYKLMSELKAQGKSIILISEELQEVIGMCDRVIILKAGAVSGIFERAPELTERRLIEYMV